MRHVRAFTLIELLVVIAIVAILLSILIPALNYAKVQATAITCMFNCKGLANGWYLYAEDNDNWLMDGDTGDVASGWGTLTVNGTQVRVHYFVADPQDENGNRRSTTLEDTIRGFQKGALWSYAESHKIYHCPSDKRYLSPPRSSAPLSAATATKGGYRSYSMGAPLSQWSYGATDTGENLAVVSKRNQFINPSSKVVWLEEADGYAWNHRTWNMWLNRRQWWDPFAIWHNERSTFGFADGHAEKHRWLEESTIQQAEAEVKVVPVPVDEPRDYDFFKKAYIPGNIPPGLRV